MSADRKEMQPFSWTAQRTRAAVLVAEDALSDEGIANSLGINPVTLWRWKQHPEFTARVSEKVAALDRAVSRYRIAKRRERVRILDQTQTGLLDVVSERAVKHEGQAPGAGTGLLVKTEKIVGDMTVIEWAIDTGLIHELRALQKQAAQELGQWSEKSTIDHTGGIRREYVLITDSGAGAGDVTDEATFAEQVAAIALLEMDAPPEDPR